QGTPPPTSPPLPTPVVRTQLPPPPAPTATAFVPPTLTPTFNLPPPLSPTPLARPNGPVLIAARTVFPPTIDGNLSDWPDLPYTADQVTFRPGNWTGAGDLSVRYGLAWDGNFLYLGAQVTDDVHVQTQRGETLFRGDSLEILLDADLATDFLVRELGGDDYQLGLSPGALNGDAPDVYLWFPRARRGVPTGVTVAALRTDLGYTLESAIPWSVFRLTPAAGNRFGFVLSASDNDTPDTAEQQSMVSSVATRRLTDPTSWGTLELAP
ncbi:MAG: sugar-binding protein, partial [Anaerolineales bacterium]|nr:sugar-binding protein [Anaerolineales bacterium]